MRTFFDASLFQSRVALRDRELDALMLHRGVNLTAWNRAAWEGLIEFWASDLIRALCVSVRNPEKLLAALNIPQVHYIQTPSNLMDLRW